MAAGLTDHLWSVELLAFPVGHYHSWCVIIPGGVLQRKLCPLPCSDYQSGSLSGLGQAGPACVDVVVKIAGTKTHKPAAKTLAAGLFFTSDRDDGVAPTGDITT